MNLVTGATGLLGTHIMLALLKQNKKVIGLKRPLSNLNHVEKIFSFYTNDYHELFNKIIWREGDVTDILSLEEAVKEVETVYHCAGLVSFNSNDKNLLLKINTEGTANLINVCLNKGVKNICHTSSIAVLGNADSKKEITEADFRKPASHQNTYALSKYLAEQEVWRGIEEGLKAVIVNPGVIIGPGFRQQGSEKLFDVCYKNMRFYTEGVTGYISAMDTAELMIELIQKQMYNERFILIENNYSFKEVLTQICISFNKPAPKLKAGKLLLNLLRIIYFFTPKSAVINKTVIEAATNQNYFSNKKIIQLTGYRFTVLKDCISFTCKSFLSSRGL